MDAQITINQELFPFDFNNIQLKEACWINGHPYFTARAIAEWLEYSPKIQDRAIAKIIERNPHINQFSTLVRLTSVEGGRKVEREIRIYDPIGLQLITYESHQPKAKAFKIATAHLVYVFLRGELKPPRSVKYNTLYMVHSSLS